MVRSIRPRHPSPRRIPVTRSRRTDGQADPGAVVEPSAVDLDIHRLWAVRTGTAAGAVMATGGRPQRRSTDHYHPEYWEESEQHRYEDRIATELYAIRA